MSRDATPEHRVNHYVRAGNALGDLMQRHLPEFADGTNSDPDLRR